MRTRHTAGIITCLLTGGSLWAALAADRAFAWDICARYSETYRRDIRPKIESGVPFELMGIVERGGHIQSRRAVRVSFDLWDEVVTLNERAANVARFPLRDAERNLCGYLVPDDAARSPGRYRLLLNPMWAGRIARLKNVATPASGSALVGVNWDKIAAEMPSEAVLFETEIKP